MNKPEITKIEFTEDEQDIIRKINECQPVQSVRTKVSKDGIKTDNHHAYKINLYDC